MKKASLFVVILILSVGVSFSQDYRVIHHFDDKNYDGKWPVGSLIVSESVLYGASAMGGDSGKGTIFRINPDGSGFKKLYSFQGGLLDGAYPCGSLLEVGSAFYGMTAGGGTKDSGVIFKINPDGSGFELLHSLTGVQKYGYLSKGLSLVNSGTTLFGVTMFGGEHDSGTVFKIETDGTGYEILHSFDLEKNEGFYPAFSLLISGSVLYGTTIYGGFQYNGTIFKINTDGTGFRTIHMFNGNNWNPNGTLIKSDSVLYGTTCCGMNPGSIYKINIDGSGYTTLHTFFYNFYNNMGGAGPACALLQSGDYLYGTTSYGGSADLGIIFKIKKDSSDFTILHHFLGAPTDGISLRNNDLLMYDGMLYGLALGGGFYENGIIFTYHDSTSTDTCGFYSFDYTNFDNTSDLAFNGTATTLDSNLRICKRLNNAAGSVFYKRPMPVACNFYTNFTFRFSEGYNDYEDGSPAGADGIAFIIQATDTKNIGTSGGGLGYSGISNSIAVEFDSYNNGIDFNENNGSHLAVMSNGKKPNTSKHNLKSQLAYTTDIPLLKADSTVYHCRIEYVYNQKSMKIWLDTTGEFVKPALEVDSLDLASLFNLINMNKAYIGFTSSTGTSVENTDLLSWSFCYNQVQPITEVEEQMIEIQNGMMISPNPATDFIEISYPPLERWPGGVDIKIYNLLGEIQTTPSLRDTPPWKGGEKVKIDVSGLAPGLYFVRIGDRVGKFVKL